MKTGPYINGQWLHPQAGRIIRNINPADTNDVIAEFPEATPNEAIPNLRRNLQTDARLAIRRQRASAHWQKRRSSP